jgi:hypothetical protein
MAYDFAPNSYHPGTDALIAADFHHLDDDNAPASAYWRIALHAKDTEHKLHQARQAMRVLIEAKGRHNTQKALEALITTYTVTAQ